MKDQLEDLTSLADAWRGELARRLSLPLDDAERGPVFDGFNAALRTCLTQLDTTTARIREDMEA